MTTTMLSVRCATRDLDVVRAWLEPHAHITEVKPAKLSTRLDATITRRGATLALGLDGIPTVAVPVRWGLREEDGDRTEAGVYLAEHGTGEAFVVLSVDGVEPLVPVRLDEGVPTLDPAAWRAAIRYLHVCEIFTSYYRAEAIDKLVTQMKGA